MSGFDIVLEKVPNIFELQLALAKLFKIKNENIVIDYDYNAKPFVGDIKIWLVINQYDGGEFLLNCSFYIRDAKLKKGPIIISKELCNVLKTRALISDDSPNPLTWIMILPNGTEKAVILDANELDNDKYVVSKILEN